MNSSVQTATPMAAPSKAISDSALVALLGRLISEPLKATSEAIAESVLAPAVPVVSVSVGLNEADRQIARLSAMRDLGDGWAGPGSKAPNSTSLDAAVSLINRLRHLPMPVPMASVGAHGNAGLFWSDARLYADIELLEDGRIGYLVQTANAAADDDEVDFPRFGIPAAVGKALARAYLSNHG